LERKILRGKGRRELDKKDGRENGKRKAKGKGKGELRKTICMP